ncbi:glycosyltransferase [Desulfosporosinus sp. FKA]|uniref:glycosyltransferase family 32 protein n=1 Tax=Desulfosporosinus sp. FKA TaxID=1969834 RepID=UPI000B4A37DF|nr:glycosyltransferase [Desulfosporosinus sp. FKA]
MKGICDISFDKFVKKIKDENLSVVCYGAGLVALSIEDIFIDAGIFNNIDCFIDRDVKKHGESLRLGSRSISIYGIERLLVSELSNSVILITAEVYGAIIANLNQYHELDNVECYIFPLLNRSYTKNRPVVDILCRGRQKIHKTIHYCWLGGSDMPQSMIDCIASWKKFNPGYEIIQWNEDNYDVYQNAYMRQSYEAKKYAFTADFLRLDVLYRYGGIYLDTDILCQKSFDTLLFNDAFCVYLEWAVPTFAICGSVAGLPLMKELRDEPRAHQSFILSDGSYDQRISSFYERETLKKYGFRQDFSYQTIEGMAIYPPEYFSTKSRMGLNHEVTEKTYAVHVLQGTWIDADRTAELDTTDGYFANLSLF